MTERELKRALGQVRLSEAGRQHILNDARERLNRKENITMKQKKKAGLRRHCGSLCPDHRGGSRRERRDLVQPFLQPA